MWMSLISLYIQHTMGRMENRTGERAQQATEGPRVVKSPKMLVENR